MNSRNTPVCLTLLSCWLLLPASTTHGQGTDVCVVDVAQVFKNHPVFNQQLDNLKNEAEQATVQLQAKAESLQLQAEQLKQLQPGSEAYAQLEQQLAAQGANLEVDRRAKTREFVRREAQLHFDTYVDVTRIIAAYCEERGIRLAIRNTSDEMKADDPDSIMERVNNNVVFWAPQKDITPEIIRLVQQSAATAQGSGQAVNGQR